MITTRLLQDTGRIVSARIHHHSNVTIVIALSRITALV